uniref:Uncharacterized protein AT4-3 n=1 Tax=Alexandrium tamarense TaxID=2926 RepID=A4PBS0_ALETA|nr:hypothetical protein [Alexandrium tamarense]
MAPCRNLVLSVAILATASWASPSAELRGSVAKAPEPEQVLGGGSLKQAWHADEPATEATANSNGGAFLYSNSTLLGATSSCSDSWSHGWTMNGCQNHCFGNGWSQWCFNNGGCICGSGCGWLMIDGYKCTF